MARSQQRRGMLEQMHFPHCMMCFCCVAAKSACCFFFRHAVILMRLSLCLANTVMISREEVSWTRSLHLVFLFLLPVMGTNCCSQAVGMWTFTGMGPRSSLHALSTIFIHIRAPRNMAAHPLCNVQCTKQHFSGAAVSQGDRVSSTVSP